MFGGDWNEAVAAFLGYVMLVAYAVGLLQWLLIRLPRQGRVAGEFEQLQVLESISRDHPDRVVRLEGSVRLESGSEEPLELLIFRGFSSCITHPTAFDPDPECAAARRHD